MLEQILQDKRAELAQLDERLLRNVRPSTRDLRYSIGTGRESLSLFVELKRRDPWEGEIRPDLDLPTLAARLEEVGIGAFVVATESRYWGGSREDLAGLERLGVQVPLLRHDFIVEELQIYDSRRLGADSLFLRPALLPGERLQSALRVARSTHMVAVVLVANALELDAALATDAPIIGISNRDFDSGRLDLETTLQLAPRIPASRSVLSCFGIRSAADVRAVRGHVDAVCLGTALLRAADPVAELAQLAGP
jgi:indole-3-glycerol phosphate synthase